MAVPAGCAPGWDHPSLLDRPWLCPRLIGRNAEISALVAALGEAAGGEGRAIVISGEAGIGKSRIRFVQGDVANGLDSRFDVITTFDMLHDAVDPVGVLSSIRRALRPDGIHVCLEISCAANLEDNIGAIRALLLSCSVLFCMTMSLAGGGAGLGTMGLPEQKLRELCAEAGMGTVRRIPLENPFNTLYEIRPTIDGL